MRITEKGQYSDMLAKLKGKAEKTKELILRKVNHCNLHYNVCTISKKLSKGPELVFGFWFYQTFV